MSPEQPPKRDSIFSSIAPAPAAAPAQAARAAVSEEAVNQLKQKIDALEKNIVGQIEKKLSEQFRGASAPPPPPPPRPPAGVAVHPQPAAPVPPQMEALLLRKIEDMERRMADFTGAASVSAAHMKNIEESKISARREISDLLTAVREQQKFSEMDRQMHEQLEKAWTRAEAMEKKLIEFYSSMLEMENRRRGESELEAAKVSNAVSDVVARLRVIEEKLNAGLAGAAETVSGPLRSTLERSWALTDAMEKRLVDFYVSMQAQEKKRREETDAETGKLHAAVNGLAGELTALAAKDAGVQKQMGESWTRLEAMEKRLMAFYGQLLDSQRQREAADAKNSEAMAARMAAAETRNSELIAARMAAFEARVADQQRVLDGMAAMLENGVARMQKAVVDGSAFSDVKELLKREIEAQSLASRAAAEDFLRGRLEALKSAMLEELNGMRRDEDALFERLAAEHKKQLGDLDARHDAAARGMSTLNQLRAASASLAQRIHQLESRLGSVLSKIDKNKIPVTAGVSGDVLRRHLESLEELRTGLDAEMKSVIAFKQELEQKIKDVFGELK